MAASKGQAFAMVSAIAPLAIIASISGSPKPASRATSRVCCRRAARPRHTPGVAELDRQADRLRCAGHRMPGLDHHLARDRLRVREHSRNVEHRTGGNAGRIEQRQPLGRRPLAEPCTEDLDQRAKIRHPRLIVAKARIGDQGPAL
jgi:hypothetical protein